jgi:hypothetical protein
MTTPSGVLNNGVKNNMTIMPPQLTPPEIADELPRNTEVSLPDQYDGGADQHQNEEEDQVCNVTVVENTRPI